MAVIPNTEPAKYGGVVADDGGSVAGFTKAGSNERSFHFIGVQVVEAAAFASLPDNMPAESVKDLYPMLIASRPGSIRAFITDAEFFDIGTPRDYFDTCMRFRTREPAEPTGSRVPEPGSRVEDSILWEDVHIDREARLRRCIVTDGVRVPAGSWENMIIRHADGDVASNERRVDDLAIAPIDGTPLR
jgi:NDP-sugar pyrophosphorylase family protein